MKRRRAKLRSGRRGKARKKSARSKRAPALRLRDIVKWYYRRYSGSPALRMAASRAFNALCDLKDDRRQVIPVARLARLCGVSVRVAWQYVSAGFVKRNNIGKPGLTRASVIRFLRELEQLHSLASAAHFQSRAGRPAAAMAKIPAKWSQDAKDLQGMTPREAAERLGISRASVLRAIAARRLAAWRPTPHRMLIGERPRKKTFTNIKKPVDTFFG